MKKQFYLRKVFSIVIVFTMVFCFFPTSSVSAETISLDENNTVESDSEVILSSASDIPDGFTPIYTADDFLSIKKNTNGKYILMNNIDMTETSWGRRTNFHGVLDGNNYIINGLTEGLFNTLSNAEIKNLNLTNMHLNSAAAIAITITNSTLKNMAVSNLVCECTDYGIVGGLANEATSSTVDNCSIYADINITGASGQALAVGGIIGKAKFTSIQNCYAGGKLKTTSSYNSTDFASGIVHSSSGTNAANSSIINCYNNMAISGKNVYGISAIRTVGLPIMYCVNTGTLKAGYVLVNEQYKDGQSYSIGSAEALNCLNIGNKSPFAGDDILYCVDYADHQAEYKDSYSLITENNDNNEMTLTAEEMIYEENFSKLDFQNVWFLDTSTGINHPQLKSNPIKIGEPAVFIRNKERNITLDINNTYELHVDVYPEVSTETFTYSSSNESVATVSANGIITALNAGSSLIEITSTNGKTTTCYLTVIEHSYKSVITPPTCTAQGFTTYSCECGDSYVADYVDANGHDYTSVITKEATHLEEGIKTFTCFCGDSYTEIIAKIEAHDYKATVTEPTCTKQGFTTYTCECGDSYVADYVKENGHEYTSAITKEATHIEEGIKTFTCFCGDSYTEAIEKIEAHDYKADITAPTCTKQGFTTYTCECGDSYVADYVKENGHEYTSAITKEATHLEEGIKTFTCFCGDSYSETIEKIEAHDYKATVTEPTCTEQGFTTYTCECGDSYVADYVDANGHDYTPVITKEATHLEEGIKTFTCFCGDSFTETIAKIEEHNYTSQVTKQATCSEKGAILYTCICGDEYTETIPSIKHSDENGDFICDMCNSEFNYCSHLCHRDNIFAKIVWGIISFICSIFGISDTCSCGRPHY